MKHLRQYIRNLIVESSEYVDKLLSLVVDGAHEQAYDLAESLDIDLDAALLPLVKPIFDQIEQKVHTPNKIVAGSHGREDVSGWDKINPLLDQLNQILGLDNLRRGGVSRPLRYNGKGVLPTGEVPRIHIYGNTIQNVELFVDLAKKAGMTWEFSHISPAARVWKVDFK